MRAGVEGSEESTSAACHSTRPTFLPMLPQIDQGFATSDSATTPHIDPGSSSSSPHREKLDPTRAGPCHVHDGRVTVSLAAWGRGGWLSHDGERFVELAGTFELSYR